MIVTTQIHYRVTLNSQRFPAQKGFARENSAIAPVKSESRVKAVPPTRSGILDLIKPIEVPCIRRPKRKPSPKMRIASSGIPDPSRKNRMNNMIGAYSIKLPCARMALFSSSSSPLPCAINANAGLPRRPMTRIDNTNSQTANNEQ